MTLGMPGIKRVVLTLSTWLRLLCKLQFRLIFNVFFNVRLLPYRQYLLMDKEFKVD